MRVLVTNSGPVGCSFSVLLSRSFLIQHYLNRFLPLNEYIAPTTEIRKSTRNTNRTVPKCSVRNPPAAGPASNAAKIGIWQGQVSIASTARRYPEIRRRIESGSPGKASANGVSQCSFPQLKVCNDLLRLRFIK